VPDGADISSHLRSLVFKFGARGRSIWLTADHQENDHPHHWVAPMRNWFRRKRESPSVQQTEVGKLRVHSGTVLVGDPSYLPDGVELKDVPLGDHPVVAHLITYPEGGRRVAGVNLKFTSEGGGTLHKIGEVPVDSAKVAVLDASTFEQFWELEGAARLGVIATPQHRHIAGLLKKRFQLESRDVNAFRSELVEPVSEELEAEIVAYLETFPDYAACSFMFFRVESRNTCEQLETALSSHVICEMVLDEPTGANLLAFQSGLGDGTYPVFLRQSQGQSGEVVVEFIGPDQEKVLEAFPLLRY